MARRATLLVATLVAVGGIQLAAVQPAFAEAEIYTSTFSNKGAGGYDVVSYFTDGKPVKGDAKFSADYKGAKWLFASADHLALFKKNPDAYVPQYGGHCAWAAAQGKAAPGDAQVWKLVNNKLYLNYDQDIQKKWEKDIPGFIASGDKKWPDVIKK